MRDAILGLVPTVAQALTYDALSDEQRDAAKAMLSGGVNPEDRAMQRAFEAGWEAAREAIDGGPSRPRAFALWSEQEKARHAR